VGHSPFCVENDYFSFFLIRGGKKSLKEVAGYVEMERHVDEAQEEHL